MNWRNRDLVPEKRKDKGKSGLLFSILISLFLAWIFRIVVHSFWVFPLSIPDSSMTPQFQPEEIVYIYRNTSESLEPGTVVLVEHPQNEDMQMIRRIVALPGDTISMIDGKLMRNGQPVNENYLNLQPVVSDQAAKSWYQIQPQTLGSDHYFVLADRRIDSLDSRFFGPVTSRMIQGFIED